MWSYVCTNRKGSNRRTEKTQLAKLLDTRLLTSLQSLVVLTAGGAPDSTLSMPATNYGLFFLVTPRNLWFQLSHQNEASTVEM